MEIIFILIPLALLLGIFFVGGFIWMTKKGQYDDLETPRHRMLLEDTKKITYNQTQKGEL
jgi:cbb3-type cytochrome oxidase maturation protein